MFEKFGEFDSSEELNAAAKGFLDGGDSMSIIALAKENGIDQDDAEDYVNGFTAELASVSMAAFGRLYAEEQEVISKKDNFMAARVIFNMVRGQCLREDFCRAVMRKGRRAMAIFEAMKKEASNHKSGTVGVSCGTDRELSGIVIAYYLEGKDAMEKKLKDLYQ